MYIQVYIHIYIKVYQNSWVFPGILGNTLGSAPAVVSDVSATATVQVNIL